MKSNYLFIIFLIFIYLTTICQSQQLQTLQLNQLIKMIKEIHDSDTTNPCSDYKQYFHCVPINDGTGSIEYTVMSIVLNNVNPAVNPLTTDFSVFKNISNLYFGQSVKTTQNIMVIMQQLTNLDELQIAYQTQEIGSDLQMPSKLDTLSFSTISVSLPPWVFSTGILRTLIIKNVQVGFQYPSQFESSEYLEFLTTVQSFYSGTLPANTGEAFPALATLKLTVFNDNSYNDYVNQVFPTFLSYNTLKNLEITFNSESGTQLFNFEQTITTIPKLESLLIKSRGFVNKENSTVIDFSNNQSENGFSLSLYYTSSEFIGDCKLSSCLLLPKDSSLDIQFCDIDLTKINYSNITKFNVLGNYLPQPLPVKTINFPRVKKFEIDSSSVTGSIPQEYCKFPTQVLSLSGTELSGDVPSCFLCYGGYGGAFVLFPNTFTNFVQGQEPNCPTFSIDSYNKIVKTDGTTILTITGKDFGFSNADGSSSLPRLMNLNVGVESPIFTITVSNTEMTLSIPQGVVGSGVNLTFTADLSIESTIPYTFNYSYEVPVIYGYTIQTIGGEEVFVLNGTGFNYVEGNSIKINGNPDLFTGDPNSPSMGGSTITGAQNPLQALTVGESFTVSVTVGGQTSETRTFYLFKSLSLVNPTSKLLSTGGSLDLTGSFSTATKDIVEVFINGVSCSVTSVSSTTVTFNYPVSTQGVYQLKVNVGGYNLYSSVEYITPEKPTPSPTTSESSEDVSFSTKLSIPVTFFFVLSILSLLLI